MKKRTLLIIVAVLPLMFFFDNCETPVGLEDVSSGIEGQVVFEGNWPEDISAVTTVVFDKQYHNGGEMLAYGMPIESGVSSGYYFLQLNAGEYYKTIFGLKNVEPAFFVANLDSFLTAPSKPFVDFFHSGFFGWFPDTVRTGEITTINDTIIFD